MVQGYYTLEEAAKILGMGTEELSQMAQHREVRAFADRGTWRFRTQDIEELARQRGLRSSSEFPLGEAPAPQPHDSPTHRAPVSGESDQVEIGQEIISETPSGRAKVGGSKSSARRAKPPTPKPGSDSDVRLVAEGSDVGFQVAPGQAGAPPKSGAKKKGDSGVRLVPMGTESDSDVKIVPDKSEDSAVIGGQPHKTHSDSDVRLESSIIGGQPHKPASDSDVRLESPTPARRSGPDDSYLTEEIDLDAELRAAEEAAQAAKKATRSPAPAQPPAAEAGRAVPKKPGDTPVRKTSQASSSDFDLSLEAKVDQSPLELSSGEMAALPKSDEDVTLGEMPPPAVTGASDSGINLQEPADSGISLEKGGEGSSSEIEFELSLDAETTPKPAPAQPDSSSEFELTLEDSARLAPLDEDSGKQGEKDIFETDFEVPALEDESGSQAVALDESDTDLESSDFDLALGEEDVATEEESGSQVVALEDEEEVDEGAATIARPRRSTGALAEEEEGLLGEELGEEAEVSGRRAVAVEAAPADWGIATPVVLAVSALLLFFVGLMGLELIHGMWGYRQPYKVPSAMIQVFGKLMPWVDPKDLDKD
jgi:excisionase family DNA binding protein